MTHMLFATNDIAANFDGFQRQISVRKANRADRRNRNLAHKTADRRHGKPVPMPRKELVRAESQDGIGRIRFLWSEDNRGNFVAREINRTRHYDGDAIARTNGAHGWMKDMCSLSGMISLNNIHDAKSVFQGLWEDSDWLPDILDVMAEAMWSDVFDALAVLAVAKAAYWENCGNGYFRVWLPSDVAVLDTLNNEDDFNQLLYTGQDVQRMNGCPDSLRYRTAENIMDTFIPGWDEE